MTIENGTESARKYLFSKQRGRETVQIVKNYPKSVAFSLRKAREGSGNSSKFFRGIISCNCSLQENKETLAVMLIYPEDA